MINQTINNIKLSRMGFFDNDIIYPDDTIKCVTVETKLDELEILSKTAINMIREDVLYLDIKPIYTDQWKQMDYRHYYDQLKLICDYIIQNRLMGKIYIKQLDICNFLMLQDQDLNKSQFQCAYCPIAEGCEGAIKSISDIDQLAFICRIHKAESLAYVYFYNSYADYEMNMGRREFYSCPRLLMLCPYDWAMDIIDTNEYNILYKLAHMNKRVI